MLLEQHLDFVDLYAVAGRPVAACIGEAQPALLRVVVDLDLQIGRVLGPEEDLD